MAFGGLLVLAFAPSFAFVGASIETLFGLSASFGLGAGACGRTPTLALSHIRYASAMLCYGPHA